MPQLADKLGRIKPSPTMSVSSRAQAMKAAGRNVINLSSGEPDFNTPAPIRAAAKQAMDEGATKYTAVGGTPALKNAVVTKFSRENNLHYKPSQIIVSSGAKHCIMNALIAILNEGDEVVIPAPYWVSYPDMALLAGGKPVIVTAEDGYKITAEQLGNALTAKTKVILFNSPSNPSGTIYTAEDWCTFAQVIKQKASDAWIICDDIYEHLRYEGRTFSNIVNADASLYERTLVINGVSKAYAMTGWRIGYAAGDEKLIQAMAKVQSQSTSNPCSISQAAAVVALDSSTEYLAPMLEAFDRRRQFVHQALNSMAGIACRPIEGAFYAFANAQTAIEKLFNDGKIKELSDTAFCEYLLEEAEIATVAGVAFGCPNYFRLSFATSDDNLKTALERLQKVLG